MASSTQEHMPRMDGSRQIAENCSISTFAVPSCSAPAAGAARRSSSAILDGSVSGVHSPFLRARLTAAVSVRSRVFSTAGGGGIVTPLP